MQGQLPLERLGKGVLLGLRFSGTWRRVGMCLTLEIGGWSSLGSMWYKVGIVSTLEYLKLGGMDDIITGKQFLLPKPEPCEPRGKLRQRHVKDEGSLVSQVLLQP